MHCKLQQPAQQKYYSLSDPAVIHRMDSCSFVFLDETRSATFDDVISYDKQGKFEKVGHNLTFGYVRSDVWIKLQLTTSEPEKTWYLEPPAPYLEYVDFYQSDGSTWKHFESGYFSFSWCAANSAYRPCNPVKFPRGIRDHGVRKDFRK